MKDTRLGFVVILALVLLVLPLRTEAQPTGKAVRIGGLFPGAPPAEAGSQGASWKTLDALRHGLREQGWVEGQNLTLELRYAEGQYERLPALAAELVQMPVDVLIAITTVPAQAAQHATTTIPIVFVNVADPVERGLVASLARPGANVTGLAYLPVQEVNQKRFHLFLEVVPQMSRVAVLWHPATASPIAPALPLVEQAARALGVSLHLLAVRDPTELEQAFHTITAAQDHGLFVMPGPFFSMQRGRIIQLALEHRLPTTFPESPLMEAGGLMSYGANQEAQYRRAAVYVDKLLRGAKPTDLPVEQPMQLELVINLKTAQALGLTIPATLLFQADKVIQ